MTMKSARILIVEDVRIFAWSLAKSLHNAGHEVVAIVPSGMKAIETARTEQPDLILMDVVLEGTVDGIEAGSTISAELDIPVIFISGHSEARTIERIKQQEPSAFLPKPIDDKALQIAIELALHKHQVRQQLRESHRWFSTTLNSLGEAVIATDTARTVTFINPVAQRLTGWLADSALKRPVTEIFKLARHASQMGLEELFERESGHALPNADKHHGWLQTRSGHEVPIAYRINPIHDKPDRILGWALVFQDITHQIETEKALRQSEERYRQFFEDDLTGDYVSTPEGDLVECNPAFARIFGFDSVANALKVNMAELYPDPNARNAFVEHIRRKKKVEYFDSELVRRDGKTVHVIENVIGLFSADGRLEFLKGYLFDNTVRKRLEEQLEQSRKMEAIGRLAGGIAHDFNNLLSSLIMHTHLLKQQVSLDEKSSIKPTLENIDSVTHKAIQLTDQILTFARKNQQRMLPLNLNSVVQETLQLIGSTFDPAITIETRLEEKLPAILGDPSKLQQVIMNLCLNARDAMVEGGTLTISTGEVSLEPNQYELHPEAKSGPYVQLRVADTGIGMDVDTQARIFEPFFTTKRQGVGTGMGLALVFGIISHHRGFIQVKSAPEKGTVFDVYLPVTDEAPTPFATPISSPGTLHPGTETILIADDELSLLDGLARTLRAVDYTVLTASDGKVAVEMFQSHAARIDLIILDLSMPRMSGKDVFFRVREIKPDVKILVSTGYQNDDVIQLLLENGLNDYLQKPYGPEVLTQKIREICDGSGA